MLDAAKAFGMAIPMSTAESRLQKVVHDITCCVCDSCRTVSHVLAPGGTLATGQATAGNDRLARHDGAGIAVMGLVAIGPMQLFFPTYAAARLLAGCGSCCWPSTC